MFSSFFLLAVIIYGKSCMSIIPKIMLCLTGKKNGSRQVWIDVNNEPSAAYFYVINGWVGLFDQLTQRTQLCLWVPNVTVLWFIFLYSSCSGFCLWGCCQSINSSVSLTAGPLSYMTTQLLSRRSVCHCVCVQRWLYECSFVSFLAFF